MVTNRIEFRYRSLNIKEESIMEKRKVADCRKHPSEKNCTVTISGKEEEVLSLAVHHAVTAHGHKDSPELRKQIKSMLEDEK